MPIRLNLGAGAVPIQGFTPIDRRTGAEVYPLAYLVGSVDEIRASHVLEHFPQLKVAAVLLDWVATLKPGGRLAIAVPDFDKALELRKAGDPKWHAYIMGGHSDPNDEHHAIFTAGYLREAMSAAGLVDIEPWTSTVRDCAALPVSLNLVGTKPTGPAQPGQAPSAAAAAAGPKPIPANVAAVELAPAAQVSDMPPPTDPAAENMPADGLAALEPPTQPPGQHTPDGSLVAAPGSPAPGGTPGTAQPAKKRVTIAAISSVPRLGWQDHWGFSHRALAPLGLRPRAFQGVFWGKSIQNALETLIAEGVDWALCLDYDSVFTAAQARALVEIFATRPDIDALAPLQCRRRGDTPLLTIESLTRVEYDGRPLQVATAHFGCTLIRLDRLAEIPKPWMMHTPPPSGSWQDTGALDDDIYFWHRWKEAGRTLFIAPEVRIGHLEIVASYFEQEDNKLVAAWRPPNEWYERQQALDQQAAEKRKGPTP